MLLKQNKILDSALLPTPIIFVQSLNSLGWSANQPKFKHKDHTDITAPTNEWEQYFVILFLILVSLCSCIYRLCFACVFVCVTRWLDAWGEARNVSDISAYGYCVFYFWFIFKGVNYSGSGCQVFTFSYQGQCTWIGDGILLVLVHWENLPFSLPVHLSVSRRRGKGGGWLLPSQSEKRLAKDLRRLRMVSAFTSSWLRLARGAGVF